MRVCATCMCLCVHVRFLQMPEEEAFCVLVRMMENYGLRELYKPSMSALALHLFQFEALLEVCPVAITVSGIVSRAMGRAARVSSLTGP